MTIWVDMPYFVPKKIPLCTLEHQKPFTMNKLPHDTKCIDIAASLFSHSNKFWINNFLRMKKNLSHDFPFAAILPGLFKVQILLIHLSSLHNKISSFLTFLKSIPPSFFFLKKIQNLMLLCSSWKLIFSDLAKQSWLIS